MNLSMLSRKQKTAKLWPLLSLLGLLMLLTGCGTVPSKVPSTAPVKPVTTTPRALPTLYAYSPAFQKNASSEMEKLNIRPCARLDPAPAGCSSLRTMIADYGTDRDKLRVLGAKEE